MEIVWVFLILLWPSAVVGPKLQAAVRHCKENPNAVECQRKVEHICGYGEQGFPEYCPGK